VPRQSPSGGAPPEHEVEVMDVVDVFGCDVTTIAPVAPITTVIATIAMTLVPIALREIMAVLNASLLH
jgi:hypothetical protein